MAQKGKHAAQKNKTKIQATPEEAIVPAFKFDGGKQEAEESQKNKLLGLKVFGIVMGILLIIYLIGAIVFHFFYPPNSKISGIDISMKQPVTLAQVLNDDFSKFKIRVTGKGLNFSIDANSAHIVADTQSIANGVLGSFNVWAWPYEIFKSRDYTDFVANNLNEGDLQNVVDEQVEEANINKDRTEDARIEWDSQKNSYIVIPEVYGTQYDKESVKSTIIKSIINLSDKAEITDDDCVKPTIVSKDPRFTTTLEQANKLASANFDILMNDSIAAKVDGSVVSNFIDINDTFNVSLNLEETSAWANNIAEGCNTVGTERSYIRPNGNKQITVSGGTYGWQADGTGLAEKVIASIQSGSNENITLDTTQTANVLVPKGQADWGGRWIDVDLTEQHAYMYIDGNLVWETDVITGNPTINESTPTGVWKINDKKSPSVLIGMPNENGEPSYRNPVKYWMPFVNNLIGLHDASWRSTFGGTINTISDWSHGCVNLPIGKADEIWNLCQIGDAVIVHY